MEELRPDNYLELYDKFSNGCAKTDCYQCPAFKKQFKRCVFNDLKMWKKWANDQHQKSKWRSNDEDREV